MRAQFIHENMQMPFSNRDKNKPITGRCVLNNSNYLGDSADDDKPKKKRRKIRNK